MKMLYPIDKVYVTQRFAENPSIYKRFDLAGHNGVDFRTTFIDTLNGKRPITAALDGTVMEVKDEGKKGYGKFVRLKHAGESQTVYAHLSTWLVEIGQIVKAGDRIGISDSTGFSTGPHLHFGYRPENWKDLYENGFKGFIDPLPFLQGLKPVIGEKTDADFAKKWAGSLIIVPELGGQLWYVSKNTMKRYRLSGAVTSADAALLARDGAWVGMTFSDLLKIPEA